jgi:hypothetical protein
LEKDIMGNSKKSAGSTSFLCSRYAKTKNSLYPNGYCKKSKSGKSKSGKYISAKYNCGMRSQCIATCKKINPNFPCPTRKQEPLTDCNGAEVCSKYKQKIFRSGSRAGKSYCCSSYIKGGCELTCQGTKC